MNLDRPPSSNLPSKGNSKYFLHLQIILDEQIWNVLDLHYSKEYPVYDIKHPQ